MCKCNVQSVIAVKMEIIKKIKKINNNNKIK